MVKDELIQFLFSRIKPDSIVPSSSQSSLELEQFKAAVSQSTHDVFRKNGHHEVSQRPLIGVHLEKKSKSSNASSSVAEEVGQLPSFVTPRKNRVLCQRMASDTDLWLSLKAAQVKYQSKLEATKESPSDFGSTELVINHIDMPSLRENPDERAPHKKSPTPSGKRMLSQEEFDK